METPDKSRQGAILDFGDVSGREVRLYIWAAIQWWHIFGKNKIKSVCKNNYSHIIIITIIMQAFNPRSVWSINRWMRLPQMLFGVRASQLDTYEQQAQTAKRFAKDKSQSEVRDIQVACAWLWFPNSIVSRHREKRDREALFRGWTVSNSFTFYEHGKRWEQPASNCLYSACERCPRCWIHSFPVVYFRCLF